MTNLEDLFPDDPHFVAQRMVRRICSHCAQMTSVSPEERMSYEKEMQESRTEFLAGRGCNMCVGTGYIGRVGIYEVMTLNEQMRRAILEGTGTDAMRQMAADNQMQTLWQDGMTKVKMGITTPSEVIRNVFTTG